MIDDSGRFEPSWRRILTDALPSARAILLVIEPRALLRAQIKPPGYDCMDELVPREIHRLLADRAAPILPVLAGGAEWPNSNDLPPELRPLIMRRAVSAQIVQGESDFSAIDARVRELVANAPPVIASGGASLPPESSVPANTGAVARPFVRNPWRIFWLQYRILICLAAVLLFAGIVVVGLLIWQGMTPVLPTSVAPSPARRATTVREALLLSPADLAAGRFLLVGEFRVSAAPGDGALLRPVEPAYARTVRIDARFGSERARPPDGSLFRATASSALVLRSRRQGADGQWTLTVRAAD